MKDGAYHDMDTLMNSMPITTISRVIAVYMYIYLKGVFFYDHDTRFPL